MFVPHNATDMQAGRAGSPQHERERLEEQLLEKLKAAERVYHAAIAEHTKIRVQYSNSLDDPKAAQAIQHGAHNEAAARENYIRALNAFNDLVIHGRRPPAKR